MSFNPRQVLLSVQLTTFGSARCMVDDIVTELPRDTVAFALLVYVAIRRRVQRDIVLNTFFPELDDDRARRALAAAIERICAATHTGAVRWADDAVVISGDVAVDVTRFEEYVEDGRFGEALKLWGGEFLDGFPTVTEAFGAWVTLHREELQKVHDHARKQIEPALHVAPEPRWLSELKRRHVLKTAGWYFATMFVVLQLAEIVFPALHISESVLTALVLFAAAGFPVTLVLSWFFNVTREPGGSAAVVTAGTSHRWRYVTVGLVLVSAAAAAALSTNPKTLFSFNSHARVTCADGSPAPCKRGVPLSASTYAVLPFASDGADTTLSGALSARLIVEGLWRWTDIQVADPFQINDELRRRPPEFRATIPVDSGLAIARDLGAGRLIMGEIWRYGDTTRVRATVYDVANAGQPMRSREVRFPTASVAAADAMRQLSDALLLAGTHIQPGTSEIETTRSLGALYAYDQALRAVDNWQLAPAAALFSKAVERDSAFAQGWFWLAQVELWAGDTTAAWRSHAITAAAHESNLAPINALIAEGMARIAAHRFPEACDAYRKAIAQDSLNFTAWFGLGDCQAFDGTVIADSHSPSGWSFRSSNRSAIVAYQRALSLVPSFNFAFRSSASSRIGRVLPRYHTMYRGGRSLPPDSFAFAARPGLLNDTLAFIPYRFADFARGAPETWPAGQAAALERNRTVLRDLALDWARAYPEDPQAYEALSVALESLGAIADAPAVDQSALAANRTAQRFAKDENMRVRLAVAEVRLLVKAERFRDAEGRAAKALRKWNDPSPQQAAQLATLAALTGRVHRMADLLERSAAVFEPDIPVTGEQITPPLPVAQATLRLLAYASFDIDHDSLRVLNARAHRVLEKYVPPEQREVAHAAMLERASRMLLFSIGADDSHRSARPTNALLQAQRDLVRGDTAAVRAQLLRIEGMRRGWWAGENAVDGTLSEVQLHLAIGDTVIARRELDALLNALWTIPPYHFNQAYQTAALGRLMAQRALLAQQENNRAVARRWGNAVRDLWSSADRDLKPLRSRM